MQRAVHHLHSAFSLRAGGDQQEAGQRAAEAAEAAGGRAPGERGQPARDEEEAPGDHPGVHRPAGRHGEDPLPVSLAL